MSPHSRFRLRMRVRFQFAFRFLLTWPICSQKTQQRNSLTPSCTSCCGLPRAKNGAVIRVVASRSTGTMNTLTRWCR